VEAVELILYMHYGGATYFDSAEVVTHPPPPFLHAEHGNTAGMKCFVLLLLLTFCGTIEIERVLGPALTNWGMIMKLVEKRKLCRAAGQPPQMVSVRLS
jgi:hypothetical protein